MTPSVDPSGYLAAVASCPASLRTLEELFGAGFSVIQAAMQSARAGVSRRVRMAVPGSLVAEELRIVSAEKTFMGRFLARTP